MCVCVCVCCLYILCLCVHVHGLMHDRCILLNFPLSLCAICILIKSSKEELGGGKVNAIRFSLSVDVFRRMRWQCPVLSSSIRFTLLSSTMMSIAVNFFCEGVLKETRGDIVDYTNYHSQQNPCDATIPEMTVSSKLCNLSTFIMDRTLSRARREREGRHASKYTKPRRQGI